MKLFVRIRIVTAARKKTETELTARQRILSVGSTFLLRSDNEKDDFVGLETESIDRQDDDKCV